MRASKKSQLSHGKEWQLQEAKNRLSQVVNSALHDGPQTITLRGKPTAIVISFEAFKNMVQPKTTLSQFFSHSPLSAAEIDFTRSEDLPREVNL